jgi:2,3-bisphosphoglycerate-independent phosphoglycerate mutase
MLIMDGWGISKPGRFNAIENARKPNLAKIEREFPNIRLKASGVEIGLEKGQMGTSEINHMIMGTGVLEMQDLPKINRFIRDSSFFSNPELLKITDHVKKHNSRLHLIGILSDGKIHNDIDHTFALLKLAREQGVKELYIHAYADGRDTPPRSVEKYLRQLDLELKKYPGYKLATMQGRMFLDRDRDWEKTQKALDLMVKGTGYKVSAWHDAVNLSYNQGVNDEYMTQYLFEPLGVIKENDGVIFTHFRTDRLYQIVKGLLNELISNLKILTFIEVSNEFNDYVLTSFPRKKIEYSLARIISENDKQQFHISETEKFAHLTFFFNGGKEKQYPNETWEVLESNRFIKPYYGFEPSMRAFEITARVLAKIDEGKTDMILVNYPNTDMVGHTGNYPAALVAAEAVDFCIGRIMEKLSGKLDEYALIITSDHGNSEQMWDYTNKQPHTQHTLNPVPFYLATNGVKGLDPKESLANVAPTVLDLMGLDKHPQMLESSLLLK